LTIVPARAARPHRRGDRGDIPGWVMVTVMTAALVVAVLTAFRQPLVDAVRNALNSVTG
jgi:hypothetical protein